MIKVLVAIPCNNFLEIDCIDSLFKTNQRIREWCELDVRFYSGYSCEMARNKAIDDMVNNSEADYLFFIDSDIVLEPDSLEKLILANHDIITGIYYKKQSWSKMAEICRVENDQTIFYQEHEIPKNIFKIDGCGFGCILIKRSVCEHIFNATNGRPFIYQTEPILISEDLWFCNVATALKYEIMCHNDVKVGHIWKFHHK